MIKKVLSTSSYIFLAILIGIFYLFSGVSPIQAAQLNVGDNGENSLGIVIERSNEDIGSLNNTSEPDLGDDQAFPFIPGFGKNSGKD